MKFVQLLDEKFWKTSKIYQKDIDIFINPTRGEINEILKGATHKEIRGGVHKGDVYAWDGGEMDHGSVQTHNNFRFDWIFIYSRNKKYIEIYGGGDESEDPKKSKAMEDRLKRMFGATSTN